MPARGPSLWNEWSRSGDVGSGAPVIIGRTHARGRRFRSCKSMCEPPSRLNPAIAWPRFRQT
jgi:hypothetical protein